MKVLKCEVDGELYTRYLQGGHAVDPNQTIELERVEKHPSLEDKVIAYPAKDTDVPLVGAFDDHHVEHLFADSGIVVDKKFVQDAPLRKRNKEMER